VGPRAGLDRYGKSRPPPGFDPRTVQPVASRYTDYATWPTLCMMRHVKNHHRFHIWSPSIEEVQAITITLRHALCVTRTLITAPL